MSLFAPPAASDERFQVPEGCGSRAEFERELERLLGSETLEPSSYELTIAPSEQNRGYLLRMIVRGEQRELRDPDCRTLFKSAVVVIAASVKPDLLPPRSEEPEPAPTETPPPPASEKQSTSAAPIDTVEARTSDPPSSEAQPAWRGSIGVGGGVVAGLVPELAPLVEIRGLAERGRLGGALSARYVAVGTEELAGERGVEIRAIGGRAAGLYRPLEFARLSAGLEGDLMLGRGTGVTTPLSDAAWSLAASLEIAAIPVMVAGWEFELALQGRWALLRPRFQIEGVGDAYRVPSFGGGGVFRASTFLF
jgi:hypothetical protein